MDNAESIKLLVEQHKRIHEANLELDKELEELKGNQTKKMKPTE
jgi:hypothetical protein